MATWKIEVSGYIDLNETWVKKASENVSNKSPLSNQLEVDESELSKLFNHLAKNGYGTFTIRAIEKRIVLPPSQPTSPCPNCSGTGQVGK